MGNFAIVQQAALTGSPGTQDFTASGVGTPVGVIFFLTSGLTNGTVANHALLGMGATDGTRNISICTASKDGIALGTTAARRRAFSDACLSLINEDGTLVIKAAFDSWITNGVRINYTNVSSAFLVTCIFLYGPEITALRADVVNTPATIDTATTVSSLSAAPTFLITLSPTAAATFGGGLITNAQLAIGIVQNTGSDPPPQFGNCWSDAHAVSTTSVTHSSESALVARDMNPSTGRNVEIREFSATGFKAYTRSLAGATAVGFIAVTMSGLAAKAMSFDSPTGAGAQSITGITGQTPQFALLLMNSATAYDTRDTSGNAEVFAVSVVTADAQYCHAITSDDGVTTTTNAEAVAHNQPVFLQKDGATFMSATFTSFGSEQLNWNFSTANGTARKWAGLFIQAPASPNPSGTDSLSVPASDSVQPVAVSLSIAESG